MGEKIDKLDFVQIKMIKDRALLSNKELNTPKLVVELLGELLKDYDREAFVVINFQQDSRPINASIISIGGLSETIANPREIFKSSILSNASYVILAHNHPSGRLVPSNEDILVTKRLVEVGNLLGIMVKDSIILGGDNSNYYSMRAEDTITFSERHFLNHEIRWQNPIENKINTERNDRMSEDNLQSNENKPNPKNELLQKLQDGIRTTMNSESFRNWCITSSKLFYNNYSFNNIMLVYLQRKDATFTMGYEKWKEFGRQVAAGAKAIKILAPNYISEKNGKGSLFKLISNTCSKQMKENPNLAYGHFELHGTKLGFNKYKNGLYDITCNGKALASQIIDEGVKKFINQNVIGKQISGFSVISVFDEKDTIIPEHLWVKSHYDKADLILNDKGDPIKNQKGEFKILNTEKRINKFVAEIDTSIRENDTEKMDLLFSVLQKVSENKNVPMKIEFIKDSDTKGFWDKEKNYIAISDKLSPTEICAVAFHEMAHSNIHKDLDKLRNDMGDEKLKITRNLKEVQAEAIAFMTAQRFDIETECNSFNYIAGWSSGIDTKELSTSMDVIWQESNQLIREIEHELKERNLTLSLEPIDKQPLSVDEINKTIKNGNLFIIDNKSIIDLQKHKLKNDYSCYKFTNNDLKSLITEQLRLISSIERRISSLNESLNTLESSTDKTEQDDLINKIQKTKDQIILKTDELNELYKERLNTYENIESQKTMSESFYIHPQKTIDLLKEKFSELNNLSKQELDFIAMSSYVKSNANLLDTNPKEFVSKALEHTANANTIKSKLGVFVETNMCERWTQDKIFSFNGGDLIHPKTANKLIASFEKHIREKKVDAEKNNEYFPFNKCDLTVYSPHNNGLSALNTRIDIGDGFQKDLIDHYSKFLCETDEHKALLENLKNSTKERFKGEKIIESKESLDEEKVIQDDINTHGEDFQLSSLAWNDIAYQENNNSVLQSSKEIENKNHELR